MTEVINKMKAPHGTTAANIQGHPYAVDKQGLIKVAVQAHVEDLRRHGFVRYDEAITADEVKGYDRSELIEFIESHGEDVDTDDKTKDLRKQALTLVNA
jgi:hypothetical protein